MSINNNTMCNQEPKKQSFIRSTNEPYNNSIEQTDIPCNHPAIGNTNMPYNQQYNYNLSETYRNLSYSNSYLVQRNGKLEEENYKLKEGFDAALDMLDKKNSDFKKREWKIIRENGVLIADNNVFTMPICPDYIKSIKRVINMDTKEVFDFFYLLFIENYDLGYVKILPNEMNTKKVIDRLQIGYKQMISPEGIPATKLSVAFSVFIADNVDEDIKFYGVNGWHDKKYYYAKENCAIFNSLNRIIKKDMLLFKKHLAEVDLSSHKMITLKDDLDTIIYTASIVTLLKEIGVKKFPLIIVQKTIFSDKFINDNLKLFENYHAKCDLNSKKEVEYILKNSSDEPIIMKYFQPNATGKKNLDDLIVSLENGCDFHGISINALPIIYTDNLYKITEQYSVPTIPIIIENYRNYTVNIPYQMSVFIHWCEENYDEVMKVLKEIKSCNEVTKFMYTSLILQYLACNDYRGSAISYIMHDKNNDEVQAIYKKAKSINFHCSIRSKLSAESFKQYFNNIFMRHLKKKLNIGIKKIALYSKDDPNHIFYNEITGDCYMKSSVFSAICNKLKYGTTEYYILQRLAEQNAIEVECNGQNKKTYTTHSNPTGERMIHFYPNMLIDLENLSLSTNLFTSGLYIGKNDAGKELYIPLDKKTMCKMPNMNICLWGTSGYGKSVLMKKMGAGAIKSGVSVLYIDYSMDISEDDFNDSDVRFYDIMKLSVDISNGLSDTDTKQPLKYEGNNLIDIKGNESWEDMLYNSTAAVHVIKFPEKYTIDAKMGLTKLILKSFLNWLCSNKKQCYYKPVMIILDEIHNLQSDGLNILKKLLAEGRGYGCITVTATQTLDNKVLNPLLDLLLGSNYQFFFKQAPKSKGIIDYYSKIGALPEEYKIKYSKKICQLSQGEFVAKGIWDTEKKDKMYLIKN